MANVESPWNALNGDSSFDGTPLSDIGVFTGYWRIGNNIWINSIYVLYTYRLKMAQSTVKKSTHKRRSKTSKTLPKVEGYYDTIIVGGGIAGLYRAYCLLRRSPTMRLLLIEKQPYLGGRVYTYKDDTMTVETGAGRFSNQHKRLWKLIHQLGLGKKIVPILGEFSYIPSGMGGKEAVEDGPEKEIAEIVKASRHTSLTELRNISFLNYAKRIVGNKRAQHIVDSFGYYSELVVMNAHDAIHLMSVLDTHDTTNHFYSLSGGLSQIIKRLEMFIRKHSHTEIRVKTALEDIQYEDNDKDPIKNNGLFRCLLSDGSTVIAKQCILALPKQALAKLEMFHPLASYLGQVSCGSLCRIYSQFSKKDAKWLYGLTKMTTNNDLRMIIPIDAEKGIVMISYTDNQFADKWHELYTKKGVEAVNRRLHELIKETLDIDISEPIKTKVFYWPCGVGYWNVGANSDAVSKRMARPFGTKRRLFVCGEHFSEKHQQWMEGALGGNYVHP